MKRMVAAVAGALLLAGALGILPQSREPEELTLLTRLSLDRREDLVRVAGLAGARAAEDEKPELLTGEGADLVRAVAQVDRSPLRRPYLGQAETLLVGEEAAGDLETVLKFILEHRELKTDITLYIIVGAPAEEALKSWAEETRGAVVPEDRTAVTVGDALADLSQGRPLDIPALGLDQDGGLTDRGVWHGGAK